MGTERKPSFSCIIISVTFSKFHIRVLNDNSIYTTKPTNARM